MSDTIVSREEKMVEAMKRLKLLGLPEELYGLNEKNKPRVEAFEEERGALVYAVIVAEIEGFLTESYLYVSDYKEDWAFDRESLENLETAAYVYNFFYPDESETGTIGIEVTENGELRRTF